MYKLFFRNNLPGRPRAKIISLCFCLLFSSTAGADDKKNTDLFHILPDLRGRQEQTAEVFLSRETSQVEDFIGSMEAHGKDKFGEKYDRALRRLILIAGLDTRHSIKNKALSVLEALHAPMNSFETHLYEKLSEGSDIKSLVAQIKDLNKIPPLITAKLIELAPLYSGKTLLRISEALGEDMWEELKSVMAGLALSKFVYEQPQYRNIVVGFLRNAKNIESMKGVPKHYNGTADLMKAFDGTPEEAGAYFTDRLLHPDSTQREAAYDVLTNFADFKFERTMLKFLVRGLFNKHIKPDVKSQLIKILRQDRWNILDITASMIRKSKISTEPNNILPLTQILLSRHSDESAFAFFVIRKAAVNHFLYNDVIVRTLMKKLDDPALGRKQHTTLLNALSDFSGQFLAGGLHDFGIYNSTSLLREEVVYPKAVNDIKEYYHPDAWGVPFSANARLRKHLFKHSKHSKDPKLTERLELILLSAIKGKDITDPLARSAALKIAHRSMLSQEMLYDLETALAEGAIQGDDVRTRVMDIVSFYSSYSRPLAIVGRKCIKAFTKSPSPPAPKQVLQ